MRASRLLALLLVLDARRGATAAELAAELEVSIRTVYRDVAALQTAGVPIWTETGPRGGVRLLDGWRARLDGLTGDEAGALFLAGVPSAAAELGLGTVVTAAHAKVLSALPPELRARAGRVRERFHLDAPGWFTRSEPVDTLPVIADALWSDRRLDLVYGRGRTRRRVDPLGLVLKGGTWYLVARHRGMLRTYRVGRVVRATARRETFDRPTGFDLASWWASSTADFDRSILRDRCRLRLSPRALVLLPHAVGEGNGRRAVDAAGPPDSEGWREVVVEVESEEVAAEQLVALAPGVEVLEPVTLRAALAAAGRDLADRNRQYDDAATSAVRASRSRSTSDRASGGLR